MAVEQTPTGVVYSVTNGDIGQEYPLTFPFIDGKHVSAYYVVEGDNEIPLTNGVQYTVIGKTLTMMAALPVGAKLSIYRNTPLTQDIQWVDGQAVYTPDIMQADDKLTYIVQELAGDLTRAVLVSREDAAGGTTARDVLQSIYDSRDMAVEARSGAEAARDAATASLAEAVEKAAQAGAAAERAEEAAERAESITGIGPATEDVLGLVKIGEGVSVDVDGKISVTPVQTASAEAAGIVRIGHGLSINTDGILRVSQWDAFPPYVPIPVWGVTLGGSDGRRAIMPGETRAREDWIVCDGGTDGKGGTMPNLSGRVMMGVNEDNPAGTLGGAASHEHTLSGQIGATTLTTAQMPSHGHGYTATANKNANVNSYSSGASVNSGTQGATTNASGGNQSHTHTINASIANSPNYQPFVALNFVMKVI